VIGIPAIFLDRDGVINENRADHVTRWDDFRPVRSALSGLRMLNALGLPIYVVTNQGIVGKGQISADDLAAIHAHMVALVERHGGRIDGVYACPHRADDDCACRKPRPGMFLQAAREHDLDLSRSYYVGDALTDVAAGQAAGCTTILVQTGRGLTQTLRAQAQTYSGYYVAHDLPHVARFIAHHRALQQGRARALPSLRFMMQGVKSM